VPGLELCVVDDQGRELPDRAVGQVCLRGTSLMAGYYGDAAATGAAVRDGWYHTGDAGYLVEGELYVIGRIKELVIVRGRNFEPSDLEAAVEEHPEVRENSCVAFGDYDAAQGTDRVVLVVETKVKPEGQDGVRREIQEKLRLAFGFEAQEVLLVRHGTLPRTTSYKKQRALTAQWYAEGRFGSDAVVGRAGEVGRAGDDSTGEAPGGESPAGAGSPEQSAPSLGPRPPRGDGAIAGFEVASAAAGLAGLVATEVRADRAVVSFEDGAEAVATVAASGEVEVACDCGRPACDHAQAAVVLAVAELPRNGSSLWHTLRRSLSDLRGQRSTEGAAVAAGVARCLLETEGMTVRLVSWERSAL
jgi:hypothetical protein